MEIEKNIEPQITGKQNDLTIFDRAINAAKDEVVSFKGRKNIDNWHVFILWQHIGCILEPENFSLNDYKPIVNKWYEISKSYIAEENGGIGCFTEIWSLFEGVVINKRVKHFKTNAFELAKNRAANRKIPLPEADGQDYDEKYLFLLTVCYELQKIARDKPFFINGKQAGEILGRTQPIGDAALKMFVNHKILNRVTVGHTGRSSEYRYNTKMN